MNASQRRGSVTNENIQNFNKKNYVVAVDINAGSFEEELSTMLSSGFKEREEVSGTDKDQAMQLWMGKNPVKRGLISTINKWCYVVFHFVIAWWCTCYVNSRVLI